MSEAGVRCVRIDAVGELVEYVAWKCNVSLLLRRLEAIGGIGEGTTYLLDILDADRDIIDDRPLTKAGVRYLRVRKFLRRAHPTGGPDDE